MQSKKLSTHARTSSKRMTLLLIAAMVSTLNSSCAKPDALTEVDQSETSNVQPSGSAPKEINDLGFTLEELRERFSLNLKKHKMDTPDNRLGNIRDEMLERVLMPTTDNKYVTIRCEALQPSRKVRYLLISAAPKSPDEAGQSIISIATLIDSITPGISTAERNDILINIGLWGKNTDAEHLHGDCLVGGKVYRTANSDDLGIELQVTLASDVGYLRIPPRPPAVQSETPATQPATSEPQLKPQLGDSVTITSGENGATMASATIEAFQDMAVSAIRKDPTGGDLLVQRGQIIMLEPGTAGRVIDQNPTGALLRIHIQTGDYIGQEWWVWSESCRK